METSQKQYNMNFPDLARFVDDLGHVLQRGGMNRFFQSGGGSWDIYGKLKTFFALILLIILIYVIYILLFRGYPRFVVNLLTFKYFHKESMDGFLRDHNMLINTIRTLQYRSKQCDDAYTLIDQFYGLQDKANTYYERLNDFVNAVARWYSDFRPDDQYYEAFQEYYIYYDKVTGSFPGATEEEVPMNIDSFGGAVVTMAQSMDGQKTKKTKKKPEEMGVPLKYKAFYEQMLGVLISKGKYQPGKKGHDEQLRDVYQKDLENGMAVYKRFVGIKRILDDLTTLSSDIVKVITSSPYIAYLVIPDDDRDIQAFSIDVQSNMTHLTNGNVYSLSSSSLKSDFSWYMFEFINFARNRSQYDTFESELTSGTIKYNPLEKETIKKYINVPYEVKKDVEAKIFNRVLEKSKPKLLDPNRPNFKEKPEKLYPQDMRCNAEFFEFVKKHPIYAHIKFSDDIANSDKKSFYDSLMNMYLTFATTCGSSNNLSGYATNLKNNSLTYKKAINAVTIFDLYLNKYRPVITKTYQDQMYPDRLFFTRLMKPYFNDFVVNRMGKYFKKTFSSKNWKTSYNQFLIVWTLLGKLLRRLIKSIVKSFNTSTNVQKQKGSLV